MTDATIDAAAAAIAVLNMDRAALEGALEVVKAERDDLTRQLESTTAVLLQVIGERDRALGRLGRLQQLSLDGEAE